MPKIKLLPLPPYLTTQWLLCQDSNQEPLFSFKLQMECKPLLFLQDIANGVPLIEVIARHCVKKKGEAAKEVSQEEASSFAQSLANTGAAFAAKVAEAVNHLPAFAESAISYLPDTTTLWELPQKTVTLAGDLVDVGLGVPFQFFMPRIYDFYLKSREQSGEIANEEWYESDCDSKNTIKISLYLTDEQAKSALETIKDVSFSCKKNPEKSCRYHMTSHNCMNFLQDIFARTGVQGDFVDFLTDDQIGRGHFFSPRKLYEYKSLDYGYIRSRGLPHYLREGLYPKINEVFGKVIAGMGFEPEDPTEGSPLPEHIVRIVELVPPLQHEVLLASSPPKALPSGNAPPHFSDSPKSQLPISNPEFTPYNTSAADTISLAFVTAKLAQNILNGVSAFWTRSVGEKATEEQVKETEKGRKHVSQLLSILDNINDTLSVEIELIDEI